MGRGAQPEKGKADAKRPLAQKSPVDLVDRVRDLEKRLTEALQREADASKREADALAQLRTRDRALTDAFEQQTATAEILNAISRSPTDLQAVLETVTQRASRLCRSANVSLYRVEGALMRKV